MNRVATGSKIVLAVACMAAAAAVIAFAVTAALSRADEPAETGTASPAAQGPTTEGRAPGTISPEVERAADGESAARGAGGRPPRWSNRRDDRLEPSPESAGAGSAWQRVDWRDSVAVGLPHAGRMIRGVKLPAAGPTFFTWDPIHKTKPNRGWRRWGTDKLVRTVLRVAREFARDNPGAPRIAVGDLSRPRGGDFGPQYGSIGHTSHQNGLDVDIYYPLRSGAERAPRNVDEIDMRLAQDLVDRFVRAGAVKVFIGPSTPLDGPSNVVQPLVHHDNHLHARLE